MSKWPVKPLEVILGMLSSRSERLIVADIGCGEGALALEAKQKVHSFDLESVHDHIVICDAAKVHTKLAAKSVDICIFSLSLMGTNMHEFIISSDKVLKTKGTLIIAEVTSRFQMRFENNQSVAETSQFVSALQGFGYKLILEKNYGYFVLFEFVKLSVASKKLDKIVLKPCVYRKR